VLGRGFEEVGDVLAPDHDLAHVAQHGHHALVAGLAVGAGQRFDLGRAVGLYQPPLDLVASCGPTRLAVGRDASCAPTGTADGRLAVAAGPLLVGGGGEPADGVADALEVGAYLEHGCVEG
jgi:hypothetical protein